MAKTRTKKTKKVKAVEITHNCGHVIGAFSAEDDHGGVYVICPKCKREVYISNQVLCYPEEADFVVLGCSFELVEVEVVV